MTSIPSMTELSCSKFALSLFKVTNFLTPSRNTRPHDLGYTLWIMSKLLLLLLLCVSGMNFISNTRQILQTVKKFSFFLQAIYQHSSQGINRLQEIPDVFEWSCCYSTELFCLWLGNYYDNLFSRHRPSGTSDGPKTHTVSQIYKLP